MADVKVVLNRRNVRELLKSSEVRSDLYRRGRAIAAQAGAGHEVSVNTTRTRARVGVLTATEDAMVAEAYHRTLTSALDAGRL